MRSTLSVPIAVGATAQAALNLYSTTVGAFDDPLVAATAAHTAGQTAAAIATMHDLETARTEIANLQLALASRAGIEQAKGVAMAMHGYDAEEAFQALSTQSQHTNTKVRDVAAQVLAQVRRPAPSPPAPGRP